MKRHSILGRCQLFAVALAMVIASVALAAPIETLDDDGLARLCADALDNPDQSVELEDKAAGVHLNVQLYAKSYSRRDQVLVGGKEDRMGARILPYEMEIDVSGAQVPSNLKKGGSFVLAGIVSDAALWANGFEGCYFHVKARSVSVDGF